MAICNQAPGSKYALFLSHRIRLCTVLKLSSRDEKCWSLRCIHGGKVSLMGGIRDDVPIPHSVVMHSDLTLKGKWIFERKISKV